MDLARAAQPRCFGSDNGLARCARARAHETGSLVVADAVDHRMRRIADLGHRLVQGAGQSGLHLELRRGGAAQPRPQGATDSRQSDPRGRRLCIHLAVVHRHRMLIAAIISGIAMGFTPGRLIRAYGETLRVVSYSLVTISAMLAIGTLTRFSGIDATLGLAFAGAGVLYPFFGTLLGWLGVALTGSDTASNVLFGGLQKITSEQLGLSPILMGAANSSGGVMGKMIDAQSIVVASTATNWFGHEGTILRFVFGHSIVLACLVGILVMAQAYIFTGMIVH